MELLRLADAARQLGISYPTLKQWIYKARIRSVQTPGGHHRIPQREINRLLFAKAGSRSAGSRGKIALPGGMGLEHFISGRNQLSGTVRSVTTVGLLAKVTLEVGPQQVTAIITRDAARDLRLKRGARAAALIKATEVMIIRPPSAG